MSASDLSDRRVELFSTILLAIATVATAWSGYQASRWHGEQAKAQSGATATRLESTRQSGLANRQIQVDVALFTQWVDAYAQKERELSAFYRERFTDRFKPAFNAWIAERPFDNPSAPESPFVMPQYRLASERRAARLTRDAEEDADEAREFIQRANNYVLAVVLFAGSLFFGGLSTKLTTRSGRATIVVLGWAVFLGTAVWVATFPVTVAV